jgi:peptidoglycan/xylan/chitin deacetylase (PgdA/CDA1 family)
VRRGLKIGAGVAAAGVVTATLLFAATKLNTQPSQAAVITDSVPRGGTFPVTIPSNPTARTPEYPNGYVALTFDDGPTKLTPRLLAVMRKIGVKATFFDTGSHALQYPDAVRQETFQGWVGNHSYSHPNLVTLGEPGAFNELLGTNQVLQKITGQAPTLFRPPLDAINYKVDFDARELGMTSVEWTTDSYDYTGASTAQIVANAEKVPPGGIILFHDGNQNTINALPAIVDNLAHRGLGVGKIVYSPKPIITSWDETFYATVVHW